MLRSSGFVAVVRELVCISVLGLSCVVASVFGDFWMSFAPRMHPVASMCYPWAFRGHDCCVCCFGFGVLEELAYCVE